MKNPSKTGTVLTELLGFRNIGNYEEDGQKITVYTVASGGTGAEIHLNPGEDQPPEKPGRGSVHHVALRVDTTKELHEWAKIVEKNGYPNSGVVERYYFQSLYFRESNGILIELATDGPGFEEDEPFESLGEALSLPPYLENRRHEIENKLNPL